MQMKACPEGQYYSEKQSGECVYHFHEDPGHGWLEVAISELKRLGIEKEISHYSYRRGNRAFLEEDSDAGKFMNAKKKLGEPVKFDELYEENTPIRQYDHY